MFTTNAKIVERNGIKRIVCVCGSRRKPEIAVIPVHEGYSPDTIDHMLEHWVFIKCPACGGSLWYSGA